MQLALIEDDFVLQQDNAPIHTSQSTRQWLHQHDVTLLDWPPKSPDANPIENLWHEIKTASNRSQPKTAAELWNALQETWQQIPAVCPELGRKYSTTFGCNQECEKWEHSVLRNG